MNVTTFNDYDPEDGWDISDPPDELAENLRRRLGAIIDGTDLPERVAYRLLSVYDDLGVIVERLRR